MSRILHGWGALSLAICLGTGGGGMAQTHTEQQSYQQRMRLLFERLDRNNDQRLQRQEVQGQPYLERHFERLDSRKRGYLGPEDLTKRDPSRTVRFFQQADRNADGVIDRREAEVFAWLKQHFGPADRNGDSRLDPAELQGLAERRRSSSPTPSP